MKYRKIAIGALLWGGVVLPVSNGGAETGGSASASARITLHIPSQARFRPVSGQADSRQLCLSHIPADNYYLSIRALGDGAAAEKRVAGRRERFCVPVSASQQGKMVLIVAE